MAEQFSPHDYSSYDELPADMQPYYKPIDNGFVPAGAAETAAQGWEMAHIQNNLYNLYQIEREKENDIRGKLELLGSADTLRVIYDPYNQLDGYGRQLEMEREHLPRRIGQVKNLLILRSVTEPIDTEFIDGLIEAYDAAEILPEHNPDDDPAVMDHLLETLLERNVQREHARSQERVASVLISEDREIRVVTDSSSESLRLDLPLVNDPRKVPVSIGPDAVAEILGAKLTDADYIAVARTLETLEGAAGDAVRGYKLAVEAWAVSQVSGGHAWSSHDDLFHASLPLRRVCGNDWLFVDVVLFAIQTDVVRQHPGLGHIRTPQPYSS